MRSHAGAWERETIDAAYISCVTLLSIPAAEITTCTQGDYDYWGATFYRHQRAKYPLALRYVYKEK